MATIHKNVPIIFSVYRMTLLLFEDRFGHFRSILRCFDTVFQRPHRYFSIALKLVFSSSDRYEIFTSNWLWIE